MAVVGAKGRMGATVCRAVESAHGLRLVATFDEGDELRAELGGADVAVDFTVPAVAPGNVAHCVARGVHVVVGTTGWTAQALDTLTAQVAQAPAVAGGAAGGGPPNLGGGGVFLRFAQQAARFFESGARGSSSAAPAKIDAPSGTAARTADLIGAARGAGRPGTGSRRNHPRPRRGPRGPAARRTRCTRCGCAAWWPTRRCCSATRGRR